MLGRDPLSLVHLLLVGFAMSVAAAAPPASAPATRPARIMPAGQTQADLTAYLLPRVLPFVSPPPAPEEAEIARMSMHVSRTNMLAEVVLKGVPSSWTAGDANIVWQDTLDGPEYVIKKLRYEAMPGLWVGALLFEPKGLSKPAPAVLSVNGHVGSPGITTPYEQIRCINLAKRGMLVLYPEWIGMGQLSGPGYAHTELTCLDLCGTAGVSVFYLELKRGLDVLLAQRFADPQRVAVTGLSGGGWQTIFISSLDERVKLAVPNAGFIGLEERIKNLEDVGDPEQNPADMMKVADYPHLTAMLAPRPALLIYNDKDDCCFQADRAKKSVYDPVMPVYKLLGSTDDFALHINSDPGTHNYLKDNRQALYRFINRHFLPAGERKDEEIPADAEVRKPAEVKIEYPKDNADFYTLAGALMKSLPVRKPDLYSVIRATQGSMSSAGPAREQSLAGGLKRRARVLQVGERGGWHVPLVEYVPERTPTSYVLVVADKGLATAESKVSEWRRDEGAYVAFADLLFIGECQPDSGVAWQWAQVISTVGERTLGNQVAQLANIVELLRDEQAAAFKLPAGTPRFRLVTQGPVSGLAALAMMAAHIPAAQSKVERLELRGMLPSLKQIVEKKIKYTDAPSLFCFGLLAAADVKDMIELAAPTPVEIKGE